MMIVKMAQRQRSRFALRHPGFESDYWRKLYQLKKPLFKVICCFKIVQKKTVRINVSSIFESMTHYNNIQLNITFLQIKQHLDHLSGKFTSVLKNVSNRFCEKVVLSL